MEDDAPLPVDLLLAIAARSDPITLVRCTAACVALRRGVAAPAFLRGLRLRHAAEGRFIPPLFRGFFYQRRNGAEGEDPRFVDPRLPPGAPSPEPLRSFLAEYTNLFEFYAPAAARGGLVALRSCSPDDKEPPTTGDTGVCDPMIGFLNLFRPPGISAQSYALLTDDCDCRFRLLAANLQSSSRPAAPADRACCCLQTQAYSSTRQTQVPGGHHRYLGSWLASRRLKVVRPAALVLDVVAHWL